MSPKPARLVAALLAVAALTLAACGRSAPPPSPAPSHASGVDGIVLFAGGPLVASPSPSSLPGGFGSAKQGRPYRFVTAEVQATSGTRLGTIVARVRPDALALFSLDLPLDTYVLRPRVPTNGPWPEPTHVTVHTPISARGPSSTSKVRSRCGRSRP